MNMKKLFSAAGILLLALASSHAATIYQIANDGSSTAWSTKSAPWGQVPIPANDYVTAPNLPGATTQTASGFGANYTTRLRDTGSIFPGNSLTVVADTEVLLKGGNNSVSTVTNLIFDGGIIAYGVGGSNTVGFAGGMDVVAPSVIGMGSTNTLNISSTLTGNSTLSLRSSDTFPTIEFSGNLSGFNGTFQIGGDGGGYVTVNFGTTTVLNASIYMGPVSATNLDVLFLTNALTVNTFEFGTNFLPVGTYTAAQLNSMFGSGSQFAGTGTLTTTVAVSPPSVGPNPAWNPASVYVGQSSSITITPSGTLPLYYQWMAAPTNSVNYVTLANGGNISGATSTTLTITNAQLTNYLNYVVVVSNAYGVVTSTVPATLTVLPTGPATNFTLNYGGTPQQIGIGGDWNNANVWNPGGLPAATSAIANPGSTYEVVVGSRMRNPTATTYNVFPGTKLSVDGDSVWESGTVNNVGELRFKNSAAGSSLAGGFYTTNYFPNLVLKGGQLNIGDNTSVILKGEVTVATNSILYAGGAGSTNQTFQIDAYLAGSGTIQFYNINATNWDMFNSVLDITGSTNSFAGIWDIEVGQLVGSGINSLGSNTILIDTNGALETAYPIHNTNTNSWLVLNGQMFLTQNDTFYLLVLNGAPLPAGTYSAATLSANYPGNFPATFPAIYGCTATSASGQITVLASSIPVGIVQEPVSVRAITNTAATFSVTASGIPVNYQWYENSGGVTNTIAGATNATYTTTPVQDNNSGNGFFVVVSNQNNQVVSSTAILTAGHMVLSSGHLRNDQYFGLNPGATILTSELYPGSTWLAANTPSKTEYLSIFAGNQDLPNDAGQQIYGWFTPSVSGDYVFYMTSDDAGSLWLSTDSGSANVYQIAQAQAWMANLDWTCSDTNSLEYTDFSTSGEWRSDQFIGGGGPDAFSAYINGWSAYPSFNSGDGGVALVAGTKYYIELDNYQAAGGQNAAVTFKLAGNPDPSSNSPSLLTGKTISTFVPDSLAPPQPVIGSITASGAKVIISGSNGLVNAVYNVLTTTNLTTPLADWQVTTTQLFDINGNFINTNTATPGASQMFYRLQQEQ